MAKILGISCFYHDSAVALVIDGRIVAAAQEERFSRVKYDPRFPFQAALYCLEQADLKMEDLDAVAYYDKPLLTFDRLLNTALAVAPGNLRSWLTAMPRWLAEKLFIPERIRKNLRYEGKILTVPHHLSHAASAYYPSPFSDAAILTLDGVGEWATATCGVGEGDRVRLEQELRFPDSLGLLYAAFTCFCGFKVNSGEYKLMGLAPYGEPRYVETILKELVDLKEDGSLRLNQRYFGYVSGMGMTNRAFARLFGGPPRLPESRITRREMDLAASVQRVTEMAVLRMAEHLRRRTQKENLCLAGGVALNCVANGRLKRESGFRRIWVQPAAGDAGGAVGAALAAAHGYFGEGRSREAERDGQEGSALGPAFSPQEVLGFLETHGYPHRRLEGASRASTVAEEIAAGKTVGFFSGRMEYGPRALGGRSILGDPRSDETQSRMNLKIKFRESFRPFAPAILAERAGEYFEFEGPSPYMMFTAPVRPERRLPRGGIPEDGDLLSAVRRKRSDVPAVTHWDYSARLQTVTAETQPELRRVMEAFERITGCPVLVNTSFNVRGEPIVCTPQEAYRCFMRTEMDALYLDGYWLRKEDQPPWSEPGDWRLGLRND